MQRAITRIYGGAKLKRSLYKRTLNSRLTENFENKYIIAEKAFKLIEDNDTLFLDTSTINIILTEMILKSDKFVTIVTNMLDVVNVFSEISNNSVLIGVGGIFKSKQKGFNGSETIKEIEKYWEETLNKLINNYEKLGFELNDISQDKSYYKSYSNAIYRKFNLGKPITDLEQNSYEYFNFKTIEYALLHKDFKEFYFNMVLGQIDILNGNNK